MTCGIGKWHGVLHCLVFLGALIPSAFAGPMRLMAVLPPPLVVSIQPIEVLAGSQVVLKLEGRSLRNGLSASFGPGIRAADTSNTSAGGGKTEISVHIAAGARTGRRQLILISGRTRYPQRMYITVQARVARSIPHRLRAQSNAPHSTAVMAENSPRVDRLTPNQLVAGKDYTLKAYGESLAGGTSFDLGTGVTVLGPPRFLNQRIARIQVRVAGDAPAGVRPVITHQGTHISTGPAQVTVIKAAPVQGMVAPRGSGGFAPPSAAPKPPGPHGFALHLPVPSLDNFTPRRLEAGKAYTLMANGQNLTAGLNLSLGSGIVVSKVHVLDGHRAQVSLHVDAKAASGTRHAQTRANHRGSWVRQPAIILVEHPFHLAQLPKPKLKAPEWRKMTVKGRILLQSPKWFSGLATKPPPKDPASGKPMGQAEIVKVGIHVPAIKDNSIFTWREENPGAADWFEVRFYRGNKLIAKRKVNKFHVALMNKDMLPTWLIPDPDLVAKLTAAGPPITVSRNKKGGTEVHGTIQAQTTLGGIKGKGGLPPSDVTWEVVGYHRYFESGIEPHAVLRARRPVMVAALRGGFTPPAGSLGTMVTREVEHSGRWPLNTPYHPTGMACGSEVSSTLDVKNIDNDATSGDKKFSNEIATADHTGERFELYGAVDMSHSPWSSRPQVSQTTIPDFGFGKQHKKQVMFTNWRFDNVYIDWGDGAIMPLSVMHTGDPGKYHADAALDVGGAMGKYRHAYAQTGSYTVRVYQLAEGDIQHESAGNVSVAADPRATLYGAAVTLGNGANDGGVSNGSTTPHGFRHAKSAGDHAYMMMCKEVDIQPRHDPASDGPLNLVAAKVRGFPEQPGDDTPPKGVSVGPLSVNPQPGTGHKGGASSAAKGHFQVNKSTTGMTTRDISQIYHIGANSVPEFSACDVSLTGGGYLYYYGQGQARLTWRLDGAAIGSSMISPGPSTPRPDQMLAGKHPGKPQVSAFGLLTSPSIPLNQLGKHSLSFDAQVIYDASGLGQLSTLMGQALGAGGKKPDHRVAAQLTSGMHGAPPLGVLPPQGVNIGHGGDPVAWLNQPVRRVAQALRKPVLIAALDARFGGGKQIPLGPLLSLTAALPKGKPPAYVAAPARPYSVMGYDQNEPCTFRFPVKGGEFIVAGLQGGGKVNVTHTGNQWSGSGTLHINLAGPDGGMKELPVPIKFQGWTLKDDAVTVSKGAFDLASPIGSELPMPGAEVQIQRLQGTAGDSVKMTLNATVENQNIRAVDTQVSPPPLTATAVLSPSGDWYAKDLTLPRLGVYDSGFTLTPKSVALDFSASQGAGCDSGGKGWMGIALDSASLAAFTFRLKKGQSMPVSGWAIDSQGLCGTAKFGPYDSQVERGSIHWDGINTNAGKGIFTARYQGLKVHVPWLDVDLTAKSSQILKAGKGSGGGKLALNMTGDAPVRQFGTVALDANGLQFGTLKGVGMAVNAQTTLFDFIADGKMFAEHVSVPDLYFGMNGKAYFEEKGGSKHVSLSGAKGQLSQGVVDLKGMDVTATPGSLSRLLFNFSTELRISDALPAASAPVSYRIDEVSADQYTGSGPVTGTFVIHKPFPDANPSTDTVIHPNYVGSQGKKTASAAGSGLFIGDAEASTGGSGMRYCGDVDLGMFGGPPVKGGFALGYEGSDDFWAAHADVSLGRTPLVPPYMTLYTIGGGLGYNVAIDSFASGSSCNVHAYIDHTPAFNAHVLVGDPSHFVYGFDGKLTVKVAGPEAGARMDYKAWLVRKQWEGGGDFHGRFQYQNGNFDGTLNGKYGFLDDKVYIEAAHDAISMHFGSGKWYVHAGTKPNPVTGHVLIINAGAWLGLGDEMYAGAKAHLNEGAGGCGGVCARVTANASVEAKITTQPHISAKADMHLGAKACAFDICLSSGVGGYMRVGALPPELAFGFKLGGCPPGHLDVGLSILPSPKPHVGGGVCFW